jgi:cardiolipin synthase
MRTLGVNVRDWWALNATNVIEFLLLGPHKKLLLVDSLEYGLEAVVGGRNIGDNYFGTIPDPEPDEFSDIWRDTDIHVRGPILYKLADDFIRRFNEHSHGLPTIDECSNWPIEPCPYKPDVSVADPDADVEMRMLQNQPDDNGGDGIFQINTMYELLLAQARDVIEIQTPYFIPTKDLLEGIYDALERGVRVVLLTNSQFANDMGNPLFYASAYYWPDLIDAGAEIYMWDFPRPPGHEEIFRTMHSKLIILDRCLFMPGSWNFDGRAIIWSSEYAFPITDESLAAEAHVMYENDLEANGVIPVDLQWFEENWDGLDYFLAWFLHLFSIFL